MNRKYQCLSLLTTLVLILTSCQPLESVNVDIPPLSGDVPSLLSLIITSREYNKIDTVEGNECLNCHSDKELLIETADAVEEIAESESKGVG